MAKTITINFLEFEIETIIQGLSLIKQEEDISKTKFKDVNDLHIYLMKELRKSNKEMYGGNI